MNGAPISILALVTGALALGAQLAEAQGVVPFSHNPDAIVDLATREGVALVRGQWRHHHARVVEADFNAPGADLRPSGPPIRTRDIEPHAGVAGFDDSSWQPIEPDTLGARRGSGRLAFSWYRLSFTVPERVGALDASGTTIVFEAVVDDYAEVWVNGRLPTVIGTVGGALVGGYNAPNRVVVTHDARPGQRVEIALFGANGPLSDPPPNFVWIRSATLDFFRAMPATGATAATSAGRVERLSKEIDDVVPRSAIVERLATGFQFTEGPVWLPAGHLLFSDPNANTIYRWSEDEGVSVFRTKSGYAGVNVGEYKQPGSNGLTLDPGGRLTVAEHGNRRITRTEPNGVVTVLADRYEGKRLNSPNDLVYRSDGSLYFTDPPFGLPKVFDDPRKELPYSGVYRCVDGTLTLLTRELSGPNGIAFSPDERYLYVGNWDERRKVVMRYDVQTDGGVANGRVFFDMTAAPGEDAIDGIKVDERGNLFVSGPGGIWVLSPEGRHLGTIHADEHPHNLAWGGDDGRTLYLAAQTSIYRIRLAIPGVRPPTSSR